MITPEEFDRLRNTARYIGKANEEIEAAEYKLNEVSTEALFNELQSRGFHVTLESRQRY